MPAKHHHFDSRFLQEEAARFLVRTHCANELAGMRLDIERMVATRVPRLSAAIEKQLRTVD